MSIFLKKNETDAPAEPPVQPTSPPAPPAGGESERFFREVDIEFLVHELKDPVAIIETGIRTLLEKSDKYGPLTPKQQRTLQRTLRNAQKARGMLNNLLEIGRSQSGCFLLSRFQPKQAALQALSDALETADWQTFETYCTFAREPQAMEFLARCGIYVTVDAGVGDLEIVQDAVKFGQILGNLIKNALHHRRQRLEMVLSCVGDRLCVDVTDDGPGIEEAHHQVIFRRYTRLEHCSLTPRDGHGLGLAGARILARCMGGEIEVSSRRNDRTTFRLTLPMRLKQAPDGGASEDRS